MKDENARIEVLRKYEILDTPKDGAFDYVTKLAAMILDVPISIVSMVDTDRIWFKSAFGLDITEIPKEKGLCASAIIDNQFYEIQDAIKDYRTLENSLVRGEFGLRFYAAIPLTVKSGHNLGTLCVIDKKPRKLSEKEQEILKYLANIVVEQLELRLSARQAISSELQMAYMLKAIYESTTEASTFVDRDFIIRYTNQVAKNATKQVFGKEAQIGDNTLDYYLPDYREEFRNYYEKVLCGESFVLERKDGTNWWQISLFPVYDKEQNIIGIANNVQDITDRKQKEILLEETKNRLDSTIEAIPHPLLIVDENNSITYVNIEFESVFGYMAQEVIGREIDFLLPERYRAGHKILQQQYLQKGGSVKKMGRYLQALIKNGTEIVIDASLNTFIANSKKYVIVILQDVTEQKKYQDTIIQQNEIMKQIAWQQSHELRRPVANILGLCELLINYQNETEEMKHKYINYMLQATKELDEIIHKIVLQANKSEYLNNE